MSTSVPTGNCVVCRAETDKRCKLCVGVGVANIFYCSQGCAKEDWRKHKILHPKDQVERYEAEMQAKAEGEYECTMHGDRSLSANFTVTNPGNGKSTVVQFRIDSMCSCAVISPEIAQALDLKFFDDETDFFFGRINLADSRWAHAPKHPLKFALQGVMQPFDPVVDCFVPSVSGSFNLIGMDFLAPLCAQIDFGTDILTIPKQFTPKKREYLDGINTKFFATSAVLSKYYREKRAELKDAQTFRATYIAPRAASKNEHVMSVTQAVGIVDKGNLEKLLEQLSGHELALILKQSKNIVSALFHEGTSESAPSWSPNPAISAPDDDDDGPPPIV